MLATFLGLVLLSFLSSTNFERYPIRRTWKLTCQKDPNVTSTSFGTHQLCFHVNGHSSLTTAKSWEFGWHAGNLVWFATRAPQVADPLKPSCRRDIVPQHLIFPPPPCTHMSSHTASNRNNIWACVQNTRRSALPASLKLYWRNINGLIVSWMGNIWQLK